MSGLGFPAGIKAGFDPTHPAARGMSGRKGLSAVANSSGFINLLTGVPSTPVLGGSGANMGITSHGPAFKWPAGAVGHYASFPTTSELFQRTTIAVIGMMTASSNGTFIWTDQANSGGFRLEATNLGMPFAGSINHSLTIPLNVPIFYAASRLVTSANFVIANLATGKVQSENVASVLSAVAPGGANSCIGSFTNTGTVVGSVAAGMWSPGMTSMQELLQWATDPWAFWYPRRQKFAMQSLPLLPGSPWLPSALTTLKAWFTADNITGTTGDPISTWTDNSGFGAHATQTGTARPTLQTAHQNGLNAIRFNKANLNGFILPNVFTGFTEGAVAFVGRLVTDPGTAGSGDHGPLYLGAHTDQNHYPYGGDNQIYDNFASTTRKVVGNPAPSLANYHIGGFRSKASDWRYFLNGTQFYNTATNTVGFTSNPRIGRHYVGANFFDGYLGEIVLLNEFASTDDWQKIEGYLAWKWGLVADLDASHPYKTAAPTTPGGVSDVNGTLNAIEVADLAALTGSFDVPIFTGNLSAVETSDIAALIGAFAAPTDYLQVIELADIAAISGQFTPPVAVAAPRPRPFYYDYNWVAGKPTRRPRKWT